jgi:hypothetical protein
MRTQPVILYKKPFTRRRGDRSQQVRLAVQVAFGAIALLVGLQFVLWVRYYESGGTAMKVARPDGVEAWLPIAALMNLKTFVLTGRIPEVHPAGMFMLIAFLAISFMYRKAFCSWICPVGTISEWLWQVGRMMFRRTLTAPRWLDLPLRGLKYILLGLFLYVVVTMPVPDIRAFLASPYGMVADVKMLDFFRHMGTGDGGLSRRARAHVARRQKRMVPLPVSVRRDGGPGRAREPDADHEERRRLHRLRQMRQGVSCGVAGGHAGLDPLGGVHGLHELRRRVPGGRSARLDDRPRTAPVGRDSVGAGRECDDPLLRDRRVREMERLLAHGGAGPSSTWT